MQYKGSMKLLERNIGHSEREMVCMGINTSIFHFVGTAAVIGNRGCFANRFSGHNPAGTAGIIIHSIIFHDENLSINNSFLYLQNHKRGSVTVLFYGDFLKAFPLQYFHRERDNGISDILLFLRCRTVCYNYAGRIEGAKYFICKRLKKT